MESSQVIIFEFLVYSFIQQRCPLRFGISEQAKAVSRTADTPAVHSWSSWAREGRQM